MFCMFCIFCMLCVLYVQNIEDYWFPPAWKVYWLLGTDSEPLAALASTLVPSDKVRCRHTLYSTMHCIMYGHNIALWHGPFAGELNEREVWQCSGP